MRFSTAEQWPLVEGAGEFAPRGKRSLVRRLPVDTEGLVIHPDLLLVADMAAGVRYALRTDARAISLDVRTSMPREFDIPMGAFDVVVEGELVARRLIDGEGVVRVGGLGDGLKTVDIWLPQFGATEVGVLTLEGASTVVPAAPDRRHWIAYGSSITQCKEADGPSETWPALVAAENGWRATNLGFGGQCHLDPVVARHIRDTEADLISLCLGINIWGRSSLPERTLAAAVAGFVQTVRDGHPSTPILVSTPITSPNAERKANEVGLTLEAIRTIVSDTVVRLQHTDDRLHLLQGLTVLRPDEADLLVDGLHPGPDGYRLMARRMSGHLAAL